MAQAPSHTTPRGQSCRGSWLESIAGTAIGFGVAAIANWLVLPLWGLAPTLAQSFEIAIPFTVISIARGYLVRRIFNYLHVKGTLQ